MGARGVAIFMPTHLICHRCALVLFGRHLAHLLLQLRQTLVQQRFAVCNDGTRDGVHEDGARLRPRCCCCMRRLPAPVHHRR